MPRKKSPWPRGLRIHGRNDPLAVLSDDHPAKRVLILHAECREFAGREIPWKGKEHEAIDQKWRSKIVNHPCTFSGFIYAYICFDFVLEEWLTHPNTITDSERLVLAKIPTLRGLLDECHAAARMDDNAQVLETISKLREFISVWESSVRRRIEEDKLTLDPSPPK